MLTLIYNASFIVLVIVPGEGFNFETQLLQKDTFEKFSGSFLILTLTPLALKPIQGEFHF